MKPAPHSLYHPLSGKYTPVLHRLSSSLRRRGSVRGSLLGRSGRWRDFLRHYITFSQTACKVSSLNTGENKSPYSSFGAIFTLVREENVVLK